MISRLVVAVALISSVIHHADGLSRTGYLVDTAGVDLANGQADRLAAVRQRTAAEVLAGRGAGLQYWSGTNTSLALGHMAIASTSVNKVVAFLQSLETTRAALLVTFDGTASSGGAGNNSMTINSMWIQDIGLPINTDHEFEGFITDRLCLETGTAVDGANMMEAPEDHTFACLILQACFDSGYALLMRKVATNDAPVIAPGYGAIYNMSDASKSLVKTWGQLFVASVANQKSAYAKFSGTIDADGVITVTSPSFVRQATPAPPVITTGSPLATTVGANATTTAANASTTDAPTTGTVGPSSGPANITSGSALPTDNMTTSPTESPTTGAPVTVEQLPTPIPTPPGQTPIPATVSTGDKTSEEDNGTALSNQDLIIVVCVSLFILVVGLCVVSCYLANRKYQAKKAQRAQEGRTIREMADLRNAREAENHSSGFEGVRGSRSAPYETAAEVEDGGFESRPTWEKGKLPPFQPGPRRPSNGVAPQPPRESYPQDAPLPPPPPAPSHAEV